MRVYVIEPDPIEAARYAAALAGRADVERAARILPPASADIVVLALDVDGHGPAEALACWARVAPKRRPALVLVRPAGQALGAAEAHEAGRLGAVAAFDRGAPLEQVREALDVALGAAARAEALRAGAAQVRELRAERIEALARGIRS